MSEVAAIASWGALREAVRERSRWRPSRHDDGWREVDLSALDPEACREDPTAALPAWLGGLSTVEVGETICRSPAGLALDTCADEAELDPADADGLLEAQAAWTLAGPVRELACPPQLCIVDRGGHHRLRLRVAEGACADLVIVRLLAAEAGACSGLDLDLGAGAVVRVDEYNLLAAETQGFFDRRLRVQGGASLQWTQLGCGSRLTRHAWAIELLGEGAEARLAAVSELNGGAQSHQFLRLAHRAPHTTSEQCFRCVAHDRSRSSFDGLVRIDPGCPEATAQQQSQNLQLAPGARVTARPQLDIQTDDVTASHGATIGRPDAGELFYLRSRGIPAATATNLIIRGFVDDILKRCHHPGAVKHLTDATSLAEGLKA